MNLMLMLRFGASCLLVCLFDLKCSREGQDQAFIPELDAPETWQM